MDPSPGAPFRFIVAGEDRWVGSVIWEGLEGPKPPAGFECDGCSNSPDEVAGCPIWPACVIHDYHYRTDGVLGPRKWAARREADAIFYRNVRTLLTQRGYGRHRARALAWIYWGRVRIWGASSWLHWPDGEEPLSWWSRFRESYGLFTDKRKRTRLW